MGKRLIISEEERNEIRGKYNLMEQPTSTGPKQSCSIKDCVVAPGSENKVKNFIVTKMKLPVKSITGSPLLNGKVGQRGMIITPETTVSVDMYSNIFFGNDSFGDFQISWNDDGNNPIITIGG
jgi:hypothetical protein